MRKTTLIAICLTGAALASRQKTESKAEASTQVCYANPVGGLSTGHSGPSNVVGGFTSVSFYPDGSFGVGNLTVSCNLDTDICTTIPVTMTRATNSTKNYTVSIPCGSAGNLASTYGCTNGLVIDPTLTKNIAATKKAAAYTSYTAWSGKLVISFDDDTDTLLLKVVQTANINSGLNSVCDPLYYVATATGNDPYCESDSDCAAMMPPMAGMPSKCNQVANACYYDPPTPVYVPIENPPGPEAINDGPPCNVDNDCLPYLSEDPTHGTDNAEIFCMTPDMQALVNFANSNGWGWISPPSSINTCVWWECTPQWDSSFDPNGLNPYWCNNWANGNGICTAPVGTVCNQ